MQNNLQSKELSINSSLTSLPATYHYSERLHTIHCIMVNIMSNTVLLDTSPHVLNLPHTSNSVIRIKTSQCDTNQHYKEISNHKFWGITCEILTFTPSYKPATDHSVFVTYFSNKTGNFIIINQQTHNLCIYPVILH